MDGQYLTSADVARRLNTTTATVRDFASQLVDLGYPIKKDVDSQWLWSIDLVEVVRVAYQISKASQPRLTFKDSVVLLESAGRFANGAKRSEALPEVSGFAWFAGSGACWS